MSERHNSLSQVIFSRCLLSLIVLGGPSLPFGFDQVAAGGESCGGQVCQPQTKTSLIQICLVGFVVSGETSVTSFMINHFLVVRLRFQTAIIIKTQVGSINTGSTAEGGDLMKITVTLPAEHTKKITSTTLQQMDAK